MDVIVNGSSIEKTSDNISDVEFAAMRSRKRGVYIYNIKKKNPDGTFKFLPSKQIIIE